MINLFDDLPARAPGEIVTELLLRQGCADRADRLDRSVHAGRQTI